MLKVLIGLGSNLDSPVQQLAQAIKTIGEHPEISVVNQSSLYQSSPQGPQDQDNFINAVMAISTSLTPMQLLKFLQGVEQNQGRIKRRHWGERSIDLDILFIDGALKEVRLPDLIIPHPHALTRDFVLIPAIEIAPDWNLPDGSQLQAHLATAFEHNLKRLD